MALGEKVVAARKRNEEKKAGTYISDIDKRKQDKAKEDIKCTICSTSFKVTIKNADAKAHADSKHDKATFEEYVF